METGGWETIELKYVVVSNALVWMKVEEKLGIKQSWDRKEMELSEHIS